MEADNTTEDLRASAWMQGVVEGMLAMRDHLGCDAPGRQELADVAMLASQLHARRYGAFPEKAQADTSIPTVVQPVRCPAEGMPDGGIVLLLWEIMEYMDSVLPPIAATGDVDYGYVVHLLRCALLERFWYLHKDRHDIVLPTTDWRKTADTGLRHQARHTARVEAARGLR